MTCFGLNNFWLSREIPDISAIYLRSGAVYPVETVRGKTVVVTLFSSTSIDAILATKPSFSAIDAYFQQDFIVASTKFEVLCGEGSSGSEGFVCVSGDDGIFWIAFFSDSNPFMKAKVVGEMILVTNNLDEIWQFPLYSPQDFHVVQGYP